MITKSQLLEIMISSANSGFTGMAEAVMEALGQLSEPEWRAKYYLERLRAEKIGVKGSTLQHYLSSIYTTRGLKFWQFLAEMTRVLNDEMERIKAEGGVQ